MPPRIGDPAAGVEGTGHHAGVTLNSVAQIEKPGAFAGEANNVNVSELLAQITNWHDLNKVDAAYVHRVWY